MNFRLLKLTGVLLALSATVVSIAQDQNSFDREITMTGPWFMDFADLNGDQIMDMVGVYGNASTDINIYYGNADGTFTLVNTLDGQSGEYYKVVLPELNGDGVPDILAFSNVSGRLYYSTPSGYEETAIPGQEILTSPTRCSRISMTTVIRICLSKTNVSSTMAPEPLRQKTG